MEGVADTAAVVDLVAVEDLVADTAVEDLVAEATLAVEASEVAAVTSEVAAAISVAVAVIWADLVAGLALVAVTLEAFPGDPVGRFQVASEATLAVPCRTVVDSAEMSGAVVYGPEVFPVVPAASAGPSPRVME